MVKKEDARKAIDLLKVSLSQVGYDEETQSYDIDRVTTGITSSKSLEHCSATCGRPIGSP